MVSRVNSVEGDAVTQLLLCLCYCSLTWPDSEIPLTGQLFTLFNSSVVRNYTPPDHIYSGPTHSFSARLTSSILFLLLFLLYPTSFPPIVHQKYFLAKMMERLAVATRK